jgi:hypothetical protein
VVDVHDEILRHVSATFDGDGEPSQEVVGVVSEIGVVELLHDLLVQRVPSGVRATDNLDVGLLTPR